MSRADELRAELAAAELEEAFLAAKEQFAAGELDFDQYSAIKNKFHEARRAHRLGREERALAAELERFETLKELHARGEVSDEEFEQEQAALQRRLEARATTQEQDGDATVSPETVEASASPTSPTSLGGAE